MTEQIGGIRLKHNKNTENSETEGFPLPRKLTVPMAQSMGEPCLCLVKKGDTVTRGMKIGDSDKLMSAPIHSPASGTVIDIIDYRTSSGGVCKAAVIETDGLQTVCPDVKPPLISDRNSFLKAVRESGCCGLGGAGFPTHLKLAYDPEKTPVDMLIVNGAECEPYITSDYREFIENGDDVAEGIKFIMESLGITKCRIGIESNKPRAVKEMKKRAEKIKGARVIALPSVYPQGAEKVLIYSSTLRIVKEGQLPVNQGAVVMNVSTIGFLMRYFTTGMPLVERRITVDGTAVKKNRGNYRILIGTPVSEIMSFCGAESAYKVLYGGVMMGTSLDNADRAVIKVNNAVLAFDKQGKKRKTTSCIRCGRCIRACPVQLMPISLESAYDRRDADELARLKVNLCINCGCCSYVCPANRRLAEKNLLAKSFVANAPKGKNNRERI